jgi:acetolactate synthase-1/2/3 large subunit
MWIDHHALFKPITKASFRLEKGKIAETVKEAIRIAMSEPRGPVHLDLPEDVALAPAKNDAAAMKALSKILPAPEADLAKAAELIAKAKRPIAVLGSTAMRLAKPELLREVIERHNLPFATTTMAKGLIDEDHPLSIGVIERACRQVQRKLLRSADLIVGLGYDTIEVEYEAWIGDVPLLQVDIEKVDVAPTVKVAHEVTGDLDSSLKRLAALPASKNSWTGDTLAAHRSARLHGHAARKARTAPRGHRAAQPALCHHDDGQRTDRRGPSAVHRRDRAGLPSGAAEASALGRSDRRAWLRHHRG